MIFIKICSIECRCVKEMEQWILLNDKRARIIRSYDRELLHQTRARIEDEAFVKAAPELWEHMYVYEIRLRM